MIANAYHRASAASKEAIARDRMREPAIVCPHCETQTAVDDLLSHIEHRCPGHRVPHPRGRWLCAMRAAELAPVSTLRRWSRRGLVQIRDGKYLQRDIVRQLALQRRPGAKATVARRERPESHQLWLPLMLGWIGR